MKVPLVIIYSYVRSNNHIANRCGGHRRQKARTGLPHAIKITDRLITSKKTPTPKISRSAW